MVQAVGKLKQEDHKFEDSLGYRVRWKWRSTGLYNKTSQKKRKMLGDVAQW